MFLFLRLILAHFIGDFLFQPDKVYNAKKNQFLGVIFHSAVTFFALLIFTFPYLRYPGCWLVIIIATLTHIVQDEIKIRHIPSRKWHFPAFIIDQILHVCFLSPIFLFKFAHVTPLAESQFIKIYNNDALVIFGIGYIASTFMGAYLWENFVFSFLGQPYSVNQSFLKYGMSERFVITSSFLNYRYLGFLSVPVFCAHLL